jgi:hypothetical protein
VAGIVFAICHYCATYISHIIPHHPTLRLV